MLETNGDLARLIFTCLDLLGPVFVFKAEFAMVHEAIVQWLAQRQAAQILHKQTQCKAFQSLKQYVMVLRGLTTTSTDLIKQILALTTSKKAKENWPKAPVDAAQAAQVVPQEVQDRIFVVCS